MTEDTTAKEQRNVDRDREIRSRAMRDEAFREGLLRDPRATLEREFGATFPEGMTIQVHEESDDIIHLVLPGLPARGGRPGAGLEPSAEMLPQKPKTGCCTCGSSTHQTFKLP